LTVTHHFAMVAVPDEAGVAVALIAILPVTVELLVGAVQVTVGSPAAFAVLGIDNRKRIALTLRMYGKYLRNI